jgi:hypothetical protein
MIAINKLTDWTGADPEMTGNGHNYFFSMINATVKNTHAAVPEKLTINLFWS